MQKNTNTYRGLTLRALGLSRGAGPTGRGAGAHGSGASAGAHLGHAVVWHPLVGRACGTGDRGCPSWPRDRHLRVHHARSLLVWRGKKYGNGEWAGSRLNLGEYTRQANRRGRTQ